MKHRFVRILALAMLLALAVSAVPATAATPKAKIETETLYTDMLEYYMKIKNWTWDEEVISVKSDHPEILEVNDYEDNFCLNPHKVGKAKITIKYKLKGKTYKISGKYTVEKYPKPIKSLIINNQKIELKDSRKYRCNYDCGFGEKARITINLTPSKGWKISSINAYTVNTWSDDARRTTTIKVKNNKRFTVAKDSEAYVTYILKKGKTTFKYTVGIERAGE